VEVLRDVGACPDAGEGSVVTIGAYDGVHLGHQAVIADVRRLAERERARSVVLTFDRHPATIVRPESAPQLLTSPEQRLELLAATGIDATVVVTFDVAQSKELPDEFIQRVLVKALAVKVVVVGEDFHFGHRRAGNVALLERMGAELGFEVEGIELVGVEGIPADDNRVSSTAIRHALAEGDLTRAAALLGRHHEVRGVVARGDGRGRDLGFPTANVSVPGDILLPADGIYAGWFERADSTVHPAALSLGRRPTFYAEAHASLLEAHLLDFDGDLYGERVEVRFVARLRDEVRFESADALVAQMRRDCDDARQILG
jgi:riboflavin kinase / FMN adenylyltransferase